MDDVVCGIPDSSLKGELRGQAKSAPGRHFYRWLGFQWVHLPASVALDAVSMALTILSIAVVTGLFIGGVWMFFFIMFMRWLFQDCLSPIWRNCYRKVVNPVQDRLTRIAERRARERAPQARDVTTELATSPGEFDP